MATNTTDDLDIDRIDTAADQLGHPDNSYRDVALFELGLNIDDITMEHNQLQTAGDSLMGGTIPTPEWILEAYADNADRRRGIMLALEGATLGTYNQPAGNLFTYLNRLSDLYTELPAIQDGEHPGDLHRYRHEANNLLRELKAADHLLEEP